MKGETRDSCGQQEVRPVYERWRARRGGLHPLALRMDHRLIFQRRAPIEHVLLNQRRRENAREASATGCIFPAFRED